MVKKIINYNFYFDASISQKSAIKKKEILRLVYGSYQNRFQKIQNFPPEKQKFFKHSFQKIPKNDNFPLFVIAYLFKINTDGNCFPLNDPQTIFVSQKYKICFFKS